MQPIYGLVADDDPTLAYLFQCDDNGLFAISNDPTGKNIPRDTCPEGWRLKSEFTLGARETLPIAIDPEPILRGIRRLGYYIWREGLVKNPYGTSQ
jgi:hypothetical protein